MFNLFKKKGLVDPTVELKKQHSLKVDTLEAQLKNRNDVIKLRDEEIQALNKKLTDTEEEIASLKKELEEFKNDNGKKVTYANARKVMNKAKLKEMKSALEKVPDGATFGATVSVYNKKTKKLTTVNPSSKQEALDLIKKAQKGQIDIVL